MISKIRTMIANLRISRFLVVNWKDFYKWLSFQLALLLVALDYLVDYVPEIKAYLPERWAGYFGIAILVARILRGWGKRNDPISPK